MSILLLVPQEFKRDKVEISVSRRNINHLRYTDDTILMAESKGTEEPLDESEKGE